MCESAQCLTSLHSLRRQLDGFRWVSHVDVQYKLSVLRREAVDVCLKCRSCSGSHFDVHMGGQESLDHMSRASMSQVGILQVGTCRIVRCWHGR
jgi:hypothetical protein